MKIQLIIFGLVITALSDPTTLPTYDGPALSMDSGYITVDSNTGRSLFYWLIEAESDPQNKPLIVWFQGGPGCSGLIGLFSEVGPIRITLDTNGNTKASYTNLGWTQFANMLFIEQPAFVGFSYSNSQADRNTGDAKAAADNYKFLQLFLQKFPKYAGRPTWFTGESYGGVYVPTLTNLVLTNKTSQLYQQFSGFMIGNPVFNCQDGPIGSNGVYNNEIVNLLYWHGLASYTNYANWTQYACSSESNVNSPACQFIYNNVINQVGVIDQELVKDQNWPSLDPDDIFQDFCTGNGTLDFVVTPNAEVGCPNEIGQLITDFLNRADVQKAIHAVPTQWSSCTGNINYVLSGDNMANLYNTFFVNKPGVKILVYSGDLDILTVPFPFTQPCLKQMNTRITVPWQPWFVNGATAGYVEQYDKITYATIKGGGHETPQYQPVSSYNMIYRFLTTGSLTGSQFNPSLTRAHSRRLTQSRILREYGISPQLKRK